MLGQRIVERELALLRQPQHRRGRELFADRADAEFRFRRDRRFLRDIGQSKAALKHNLPIASDEHRHARAVPFRHLAQMAFRSRLRMRALRRSPESRKRPVRSKRALRNETNFIICHAVRRGRDPIANEMTIITADEDGNCLQRYSAARAPFRPVPCPGPEQPPRCVMGWIRSGLVILVLWPVVVPVLIVCAIVGLLKRARDDL